MCQKSIKELAKKYGGCGVYLTSVFKKHLEIDHNLTIDKYFCEIAGYKPPICECGICNKTCTIAGIKTSNFHYRQLMCGRNEGMKIWSEEAKHKRLGPGNPMFRKKPWNKGLTLYDNESLKTVSEKLTGRKVTEETKQKLRDSRINGNYIGAGMTGKKHSEESKEKMRLATLELIKSGKFKHLKSTPHIKISKILQSLNIEFIEEYIIDCWSFDFFIPSYNLLLEVDGDYFHSNPLSYPNGPVTKTQKINYYRDKKKNTFCDINNLTLIRFWERDILNSEESIKCTLKELCRLDISAL